MPKTIETLESELDATRDRCLQAERDGAELAQRYERLVASKDDEIKRLRTEDRGGVVDCKNCDRLRLFQMIAATYSLLAWLPIVEYGKHEYPELRSCFPFLITLPSIYWWLSKKWRVFKRRVAWRGFSDNDIYRKIRVRWNSTLDRFHMG